MENVYIYVTVGFLLFDVATYVFAEAVMGENRKIWVMLTYVTCLWINSDYIDKVLNLSVTLDIRHAALVVYLIAFSYQHILAYLTTQYIWHMVKCQTVQQVNKFNSDLATVDQIIYSSKDTKHMG